MKKDKLIESFFFQKENLLSESLIEELVRQQFSKNVKEAKKGGLYTNIPKEKKLTPKAIKSVEIAEIPWREISGPADKIPFKSEQRSELEQFLQNIKGNTLENKLDSINALFSVESVNDLGRHIPIPATLGGQISLVISYLVFLKTMTRIITNYNESSVGFMFESFLAVLLNGKQIPVSRDNPTLADLIGIDGGQEIYISTKMLTPHKRDQTTNVGGSFNYLAEDFRTKNFIRYIVGTKKISGRGSNAEGVIELSKIDINLNNIYDILYSSLAGGSGGSALRLPKEFIAGGASEDYQLVKDKTLKRVQKVIQKENKIYNEVSTSLDPFEQFESVEASVKFYNSLTDKEKKIRCIKNCYGAIGGVSFNIILENLPRNQIQPYGHINVGQKRLDELLEKCINSVQGIVLGISQSINELNDIFSEYIAGSLADDEKAAQSQRLAKEIDKSTGILRSEFKK